VPRPALLVAITLPLLLAVTLAAVAITVRVRGTAEPDTGPLPVAPLDAPAAAGPECTALLVALPDELPGDTGPLPVRPLAEPAPPGVRAWAAAPQPVVLRCGLARPVELTPTSLLLEVDGVSWLPLADGATYVAVDRPVYVALTVPGSTGTGPLQVVSEAVRATLPLR
jgi:hypothetical protein